MKSIVVSTAVVAAVVTLGLMAQPSKAQLGAAAAASEVRQASGEIKAFLAKHKCFAAAEEALVKQLEEKGIEAERTRLAFNVNKSRDTASIELGQDNPGVQVRALQALKLCKPRGGEKPSRERPTPGGGYKPPGREGD